MQKSDLINITNITITTTRCQVKLGKLNKIYHTYTFNITRLAFESCPVSIKVRLKDHTLLHIFLCSFRLGLMPCIIFKFDRFGCRIGSLSYTAGAFSFSVSANDVKLQYIF